MMQATLRSTDEVGKSIKELRGNRSQEEIAAALGCTKMAISQYETGIRMPNDKMKVAIANFFGVTVGSLFFTQG
ncbi:helix-turn-helix domain-containing protein [Pseudobutyrivibrio sp.]|uniref:helix-turn-helix domain-containing protein n=1 Tax=Pseudobutyrivibrio sp. TaxID=2014367 RepID=UPI002ED61B80